MPELRLRGGALDGLRLHYLEEGQGPVTVLIHGLGGFAESWRRTVPALARFGTVIALDLPGFGQSAKPRMAYRLSFLAQVVQGLAEDHTVVSVHLALFAEMVDRERDL